MSYEHRLVEAANGREFYDKIGRDADAEIAALHAELERKEAERDEWKRKYETQCAGSMSAHERRIHLEADLSALRAELEARDSESELWHYCGASIRKYGGVVCSSHRGPVPESDHFEPRAEILRLRAELQRKDAALKDLAELSRYDPGYPYSYTAETACKIMNEMRYAARAALQPKEPPCKA